MVQLQVLNKVLQTQDYSIVSKNNFNSEYFSEFPQEFNYLQNYYETYHTVCSYETFVAKFPKFECITVTDSVPYLVDELKNDYNTRKIASTFNKIKSLLLDGRVDDAILYYKTIGETLNKGASLTCVDILRDTSRYDAYVERTKNFNKYYISTGFKELDDIIGGFDREEELATIIARPNVGKSWLLLKCAVAAVEQGLNVGLYSGEMSERKVGYRFDTLVGHINNGGITHGNASCDVEYKKYIDALPNKFKGSLKVLTPKMISGPADVNALRVFIENENLDILFVDQLTLLEDQRKGKTTVDKMSNISRDLKNLQVLCKKPIISVTQMNREKNDEGVELIDLSQIGLADRIGQDSTVVIGISRDKKDVNLLKLHLVKSRDSENSKMLSYYVDFNKGYFNYINEDEDDEDNDANLELEKRYASPQINMQDGDKDISDGEEVF